MTSSLPYRGFVLVVLVAGCHRATDSPGPRPPPENVAPLHVQIEVTPPPVATMQQVHLNAVAMGGIDKYTFVWDFDAAGGRTVDAVAASAKHVYAVPGQYTITAHVVDGRGCRADATTTVAVGQHRYANHCRIELHDVVRSRDNPYIIDGYEIAGQDNTAIVLRDCDNIVIRNCYLHGSRIEAGSDGLAIHVHHCRNIVIQNVYAKDNTRGMLIDGDSTDITVERNVVAGCTRHDAVSFQDVRNVEVRENVLMDNGRFWDDRISGISFNGVFHNVSVHDNLVINSNSDGIELAGDVQREVSSHVDVYANVLRNNGEQGAWLFHVKDSHVHDNYVERSHNNGVFLEGWVSGVLVEQNVFVQCGGIPGVEHHGGGAVAIQMSCDNTVRDNICVDSTFADVTIAHRGKYEPWMKGMDIRFRGTMGNRIIGNTLCSSECNVSVENRVGSTTIRKNTVWLRRGGDHFHGCRPDKTNRVREPRFRDPKRGDFRLLSGDGATVDTLP